MQRHVDRRVVAVARRLPAAYARRALRGRDEAGTGVRAEQALKHKGFVQQRPLGDAQPPPRALTHVDGLSELERA